MKKIIILIIPIVIGSILMPGCKEVDGDLAFVTQLDTTTNCYTSLYTGYTWRVIANAPLYVANTTNSWGVTSSVMMYWDINWGGWRDFCGNLVYLGPPVYITVKQYVTNKKATKMGTKTLDIHNGQLLGFVKGIDTTGNTITNDTFPMLNLGTLGPNDRVAVPQHFTILTYGSYQNNAILDPYYEVTERDRDNNTFNSTFNMAGKTDIPTEKGHFKIERIQYQKVKESGLSIKIISAGKIYTFNNIDEVLADSYCKQFVDL